MTETTRTVDIRVTTDITISVAVAAYLIDFIGFTGKLLARQNGMPLPDMAATIEHLLRDCVDLRATCANASTQADFRPPPIPSEPALTVNHMAAELKRSKARCRQICQSERLGQKVGNQWLIPREDFEMYKTSKGIA